MLKEMKDLLKDPPTVFGIKSHLRRLGFVRDPDRSSGQWESWRPVGSTLSVSLPLHPDAPWSRVVQLRILAADMGMSSDELLLGCHVHSFVWRDHRPSTRPPPRSFGRAPRAPTLERVPSLTFCLIARESDYAVGVSRCSLSDPWDGPTGLRVAFGRARARQLGEPVPWSLTLTQDQLGVLRILLRDRARTANSTVAVLDDLRARFDMPVRSHRGPTR